MSILKYNIKRLLKDKWDLILMIIMPIVLTLSFTLQNSGETSKFKIAFIDRDNSKFTNILKENLAKRYSIKNISKKNIQDELTYSNIDFAVVIPKGFTECIIHGNKMQIEFIYAEQYPSFAKVYINSILNSACAIGKLSLGNETAFYNSFEKYRMNFSSISYRYNKQDKNKNVAYNSMRILIWSMILYSTLSSTLILKDKRTGVLNRLLSSPVSPKRYMFENILSFLILSFIQIVTTLSIFIFLFKINFGSSLISIIMILMVFSLVVVSLGVCICNFANNENQAKSIDTILTFPLAALGGCLWPVSLMPETMKNIAMFIPTTWALNAISTVLTGESLSTVYGEIFILLLFTTIFFLLSSWNKKDILKN